jgi:hypothetical protein
VDYVHGDEHREQPLAGGQASAGVVRVGSTVRRRPAPNAAFAHRLLEFLEARGFGEAPRHLGTDDEGREVLSFIDGWTPPNLEYGAWSEGQLVAVARLLRRFHDATSGSELAGVNETVRHGDVSPPNVVWRDGCPIALLDFDQAEPGSRIDDVAYMCWTFVLAGRDDDGFVGTRLRARRLRLVCDAYGLHDRNGFLDAIRRQQLATKALVVATSRLARNKRSPAEVRTTVRLMDAEIEWLEQHSDQLVAELTGP